MSQCDDRLASYLDGDNHSPPGKRQRVSVHIRDPRSNEDRQRIAAGLWESAAKWTALDLESEGHTSPERIPPEELRSLVREGNR